MLKIYHWLFKNEYLRLYNQNTFKIQQKNFKVKIGIVYEKTIRLKSILSTFKKIKFILFYM